MNQQSLIFNKGDTTGLLMKLPQNKKMFLWDLNSSLGQLSHKNIPKHKQIG